MELKIEPPAEATRFPCSVGTQHDGKEMTLASALQCTEGLSARPQWTMDLSRMKPPDDPVSGKFKGIVFNAENVPWQRGVFWCSRREDHPNLPEWRTATVGFCSRQGSAAEWQITTSQQLFSFNGRVGHTVGNIPIPLAPGVRSAKDCKVFEKIYLRVCDAQNSFIAGSFVFVLGK